MGARKDISGELIAPAAVRRSKMTNYRIAEARNAKGWSQGELAKRVGTSQQQIARYESGDNDVKTSVLIKLSAALGVSINYPLGIDGSGQPDPDPRLSEITDLYRSMSADGRRALLASARGLARSFPESTIASPDPKTRG